MGQTKLQRAARERQKRTGEKYVIALRAVKEEMEREKEEKLNTLLDESPDEAASDQ